MKKFILGLSCGLVIACSSVAFASGSIQALLFPASFEVNGSNVALNNEYKVLNVDGHAYVPIRFVAENLGATIDYDPETEKILVKNGSLDLTDPDFNGISVGNLILTKDGQTTKVTGQLKLENMGNEKNMVGANLSFYNDKVEKIGEVAITGTNFGNKIQTFEAIGTGDFRAYSTVKLHIGALSTPKHSYNLKIEAGEGGTIPAGKEIDINGNYEEGSKIPIIARSNVGYYFVNWTSINGGTFADANDSQTTFTMPGKDTIVTARFALEKIK